MAKLKFICNYCPAEFAQVKHLFDHYQEVHQNKGFKLYDIKHRPTGDVGLASAPTPEEACARICWDFKECEVKAI